MVLAKVGCSFTVSIRPWMLEIFLYEHLLIIQVVRISGRKLTLSTKYNKILMTDISVQVFFCYACTSSVRTFCISLSLKLCGYIETPTPSFLKAFVYNACSYMSDNNKIYHHTANAPLIDCMNLQESMRIAFQDVSR